ncbi:MAG: hypothetical protein Aurels2KO_00810 [Aureliella sp.]
MRNWVAVACVLLVVFAFLVVAVRSARDAARRMQSQSNLKSLALAILNYESAYGVLPMGADPDRRHGWLYRCLPFIEPSTLYSQIEADYAWDHDFNAMHFRDHMHFASNPRVCAKFSKSGFGLSHYAANANLIYAESKTRLADFDDRQDATWCIAERFGSMRAWGSPYNWCSLKQASRSQEEMFLTGGPVDRIQLVMLDLSVRSVAMGASNAELEVFGGAMDRTSSLVSQPPLDTPYSETIELSRQALDFGDVPEEQQFAKMCFFNEVVSYRGQKSVFLGSLNQELAQRRLASLKKMHPGANTIVFGNVLDDRIVEQLLVFASLESLHVDGSSLSDAGITKLASHPALREIAGLSESDVRRLDALRGKSNQAFSGKQGISVQALESPTDATR